MTQRLRSAQLQILATAFLALFAVVGVALYGLPFFYDFMVREIGWTRGQVTSGNAYSKLLVGPLFGFIAGWIIDRFGPRKVMIAGITMAGITLIGLGQVSALWMFYFFYLFNALGYVCGGPLPNQVLLSQWFDKARGKAMGFAYLGIGIGGAIVPLLAYWLTEKLGWRGALQTLGFFVIAVALPLPLLVRQSPENQPKATPLPSPPIRDVLKSASFYLLAIGSMCSIGAVGGTNQNLKLYLSLDCGYTQAESARFLSLVLASSLVGRLLMGWMVDRYTKKNVMLLIYALVAGSIPLLFFASSPQVLYLFAIIFGIGLGGDYMIIPLMAAELFGVKGLGKLLGIILTADGVMEALIPMLIGKMRDASASYATGFMTLIGLALAGAFAVALLRQKKIQAISEAPLLSKTEA